jgi:hypothetical protein
MIKGSGSGKPKTIQIRIINTAARNKAPNGNISMFQGYTSVMVSPCLNYVYVSCMDGIIYKYDIHNAVQRSVSFVFNPEIWLYLSFKEHLYISGL